MSTRSVILTGPFRDDDLQDLAKVMRKIERRQPDKLFSMLIDDRNATEKATAKFFDLFPTLPGDEPLHVTISKWPKG